MNKNEKVKAGRQFYSLPSVGVRKEIILRKLLSQQLNEPAAAPACDCDVIHDDTVRQVQESMPIGRDFYDLANMYKMFADGTRLKILWALSCSSMCVCDLAVLLGMTKSAISHQLKSLRLGKLVKYEKKGKIVFYSLADDHVKGIFQLGFEHIRE